MYYNTALDGKNDPIEKGEYRVIKYLSMVEINNKRANI